MQMDPGFLDPDDSVRLTAVVSGRVQGVNFRYYTYREARRLRLTGWVRNERGGTVRVTAEGARGQLDKLVEFLWHGSPAARVDKVDVSWSPASREYNSFEVRY